MEMLQSEVVLPQLEDKRKDLEKFIRCMKLGEGKSLSDKLLIFVYEYPDLNELIQQWIEKQKQSEIEITDEEPRTTLPISPEGIQFMTMHNAKGLDAKYVFIPFLERDKISC